MELKHANFDLLAEQFDRGGWEKLHEEMSFSDYITAVAKNPRLARNSYQMLYDMVVEAGTEQITLYRKTYTHYKFFDQGEVPIFGLDETLDALVKFFRGAAGGYGTDRRVLLLHGPVGSAKSTICRLLKQGMETYSRTDEGAWYTFKWVNLPTGEDGIYTSSEDLCPMHSNPLLLIPEALRKDFVAELNEVFIQQTPEERRSMQYDLRLEGDIDPRSRIFMSRLLEQHNGDWKAVMDNHIRVVRMVYSEADRCGIATFQPKDEKNQDSTELTGDIHWGQLPKFGSDSDARAFSFDGEFCKGNRGLVEFIEMLKLDKAFLYDLLGATQEKSIKPKKFPQIGVDFVLVSHTNNPEYEKFKNDQTMEALRDRTYKIDVPYQLRWEYETSILEHFYGPDKVKQHIAPHTLEIASLWSILTRLRNDKDNKLSLVDKAKLYDGKQLPGWTEDSVKELRDKYEGEGMFGGVSIRYVQDKISNCLSSHHDYINMFMVLNELKDGLDDSSLINNKEELAHYINCIDLAKKELDDILKKEVQRALVGDEDAIVRLCTNYIDNVMAYIDDRKVTNKFTGEDEEPDERLMRSIEEKIDIPEVGSDDFRRMLAGFIGQLAIKNEKFRWDSNPQLKKALEAKLYEDTKDQIKLSALNIKGAAVVDEDIQEKIDAIKTRLIKQFGYNEQSATDVLDYVGSIFARGDAAEE
jgi:serine protein kinase